MEDRAAYGPSTQERPRLTVVKDLGVAYSPLPHTIMRDTSLSPPARLLYAILQGHWWQAGECWASHAVLATELGCTLRSLRAYLDELIGADAIEEKSAGSRRAKVYTPHPFRAMSLPEADSNTSKFSDCEPVNTSKTADCEPSNRKVLSVQSEKNDISNTSKFSDSYKKTPEKKTKEEDSSSLPAECPEREVFDYYRLKIQPKVRINAPEKIRARLKKFTTDELKAGIDNFAADAWWMENNGGRGVAWFFHSDQRSEQFLNLKPRPASESRNGSDRLLPGAASKQQSKWSDFKGRHGGNVVKAALDGR